MASRRKTTSHSSTAPISSPTTAKAEPVKTIPTTSPIAPIDVPTASVVTEVKKKDLIEKIAESSGVKKGQTKKVVEALLKEMGDILQEGGELNVPPLGKLSVNRQKEVSNAFILITKLRRPKGMLAEKTDKVDAGDTDADATSSETDKSAV
jgi:hypothetical protein